MIAAEPTNVPTLHDGVWTTLVLATSNLDEELRANGYDKFTTVGDAEWGSTGLAIEVYRTLSDNAPSFLFVIHGHDGYELAAAVTLPDAMRILAKWLPAVQAAATTSLVTELRDPERTELADGIKHLAHLIRNTR